MMIPLGHVAPWQGIGGLIFVVLFIWSIVRVLHKAGYSGWWALLAFVPVVNLVMLYIFAFVADWPNLNGWRREVRY
jgi:uncharacterized membrane protein YhaH (DUF805 family)